MNAPHSLSQLIQSVEDSKGWTLREIARRVERTGRTMSHAYVAKLKREPIRSVTYETIHALSVGLELPERIVATAVLESMGVHDIETSEAGVAVAIARDPDLSERDRRILLAVVREMQSERPNEDPAGERNAPTEPSVETAGGSAVADQTQPDGITSTAGVREQDTNRGVADAGELVQDLERSSTNDRPWEQDEYLLAAKRGRNRGEAREQQDRDGEGGGA